ncbi:MAG: hypothetical protein Q9219_006165 [cf. Caloplaca sp. 3 TL-2023]
MSELDPVRLADPSDLTIEVVEYDNTVSRQPNQAPIVLQRKFLAVDRQTLRDKSEPLKALLDPKGKHQEASMNPVTLKDDNVAAMEICFRVLHLKGVPNTNEATISTVRQVISSADKYLLDVRVLYSWFQTWYAQWKSKNPDSQISVSTLKEMLFPTWRLDHARGFAFVTKKLAYENVGHITEASPEGDHLHLHLPSRLIQQLNAARGRLRNILHQHLFGVTKTLLKANCSCKEKTLFYYLQALDDVRVWPLESEVSSNSMRVILDRLQHFDYEPAEASCLTCKQDFNGIVKHARLYTFNYFDGLCLDCMDRTKPKTGSEDSDYWMHDMLLETEWDDGCRFSHGQPTWYFSFMGRKEARDRFLEIKRSRSSYD